MREIKFRGKRVDNGEWVVGNYATFDLNESGGNKNTTLIILENSFYADYEWLDKFYKIHKETLGQFTGLHDKNGKEIYEGDIVLCDRHINDAFDKTTFLIGVDEYFRYQGISKLGNEISVEEFKYAEIIGNIHEEDKEKLK